MDEALGQLAGLLLAADTFDDLTAQVAQLATRTIASATTCAITIGVAERTLTVASADALGRLLDEQQYDIDEGPCLEAMRTRQVVFTDDMALETRWDGYPARVVALGIAAVRSTPLLIQEHCLGALNLYADTTHPFDQPARETIAAFANVVTAGIAGALRGSQDLTLSDHLRTALTSREVIDQAIGIVIAQQHCSPQEAFAVLRKISQSRNVRLRDIAAELVHGSVRTPPDPGP